MAVGKVKRQGQRRSDRGEKQGQRQGQQQISPLHIRASANVPVEMTPKNKSKVKGNGNSKGNSRFLHCTFAQARTFRSK
jgi:phosphatidate phosphatase APP1